MTLAPAVATIHEMQRLGLVERAAELAPYVEGKLRALKEKHPSVGDVRGKGLFWAVELVKNRVTKEAVQQLCGQDLGQAAAGRPDCREVHGRWSDHSGLGVTLRCCATADCDHG